MKGVFRKETLCIIGTYSKTTTRQMIKHILSSKYNLISIYKSNYENSRDIYYLTSTKEKFDIEMFEIGQAYPKNLIYKHHLGSLLEAYLNEKSKPLIGFKRIDSALILNRDDENIKIIDISRIKNIVYFSVNTQSDFTAKNITYDVKGISFTLCHEWEEYKVIIPSLGKYDVYNALAAIATASTAGFKVENTIDMLKNFKI